MIQTLDKSLVVGLALVVVLLALNIGVAYHNTQQLYAHGASVAQTQAVLDALGQLLSTVKDAETGERGFLITGDREFLEPYNTAVAAIDEEIRYLGALTRHDFLQQDSFSTLKRLIVEKQSELQHSIEVRTDQGFKAARALVQTGGSRRTMDAIREVAGQMRQAEQERLARRAEAAERSYQIAVATELFAGLLGLCVAGAFTNLLWRHLRARSRADAALREEKEWFVTTLASIGDAVIATDGKASVTFLNPVAQALTGWTREEAIGQPLDKVLHIVNAKTREMIENPAQRALREGKVIGLANQTVLVAKNGVEWPIEDSAAPIRDKRKGIVGVVLVFRDVTERRRVQQSLRFLAESGTILSSSLDYEATLKNVVRLAVEGLCDYCYFDLVSDGGQIKRVAWAHRDDTKESTIADIWRCGPFTMRENDPVAKALSTGQIQSLSQVDDPWLRAASVSPEHYRYMREMKCYSLMSVPVGLKGRTLGALTLVRCLEGRRNFTDADRDLAEELGRRAGLAVQNAILHQQVEQSAEELREADRRKDEFLAVLAHELRNPLAPLRNGLQIIRMVGKEGYTAERAQEIMERQLQQMVRLIDDLLDISRVTEGRLGLRKETVDLAAVVNSAVEISQPGIKAAGQTLTLRLPSEPVFVNADPLRLSQVFSNLLNNSVKYSSRGASITLTAEKDGTDVVVKVKDTGVGIPREMLTKVFEPFRQIGSSLERAQGGLGIGLTLVKQLVEMHGGSVEARSEGLGKGSEFLVRLPMAAKAEPREHKEDDAGLNAVPPGWRILVADDNVDAANSLGALLRIMGHDVRVTYDGHEAVELAETFRPDVALLDIGMPRLSGYDTARAFRARPWGADVMLIALTGYGQMEDRRRTKEAGFDHHMVKPADVATLEKLFVGLRKGS